MEIWEQHRRESAGRGGRPGGSVAVGKAVRRVSEGRSGQVFLFKFALISAYFRSTFVYSLSF